MIARANTVAFQGIDVLNIDVQVHLSPGLPAFTIVGLPDKAVAESKERVRAALFSLGLSLPPKRIVVNLAPADVMKEGSHFDLAIALGMLVVLGVTPADILLKYIALGELALDGKIARVAGVLPAAIEAMAQQKGLICPAACGPEAAWAGDLEILAPASLLALLNHFKGTQLLSPPKPALQSLPTAVPELAEVKGQESAKRALEVAAAGGHNLLMMGPPGAGKSMLASRLVGLLPALSPAEALETTMIHSVAGNLPDGALLRQRPFRAPHHSASLAALVGGGAQAKPGEISLAHLGVLFLDELPEFSRFALEALRQPLETGTVMISRAQAKMAYPARVQLVAAMNPCRCGYMGDIGRQCGRVPRCGRDYQSKISGPLLDRIDICFEVTAVSAKDLSLPSTGETTAVVAARIQKARDIQAKRFEQLGVVKMRTNAEAEGKILEEIAPLTEAARQLLTNATDKLKLSARGYHRVIRVARTLADLQEEPTIDRPHIAEALGYRRMALEN